MLLLLLQVFERLQTLRVEGAVIAFVVYAM